jgi:hypothetical protein
VRVGRVRFGAVLFGGLMAGLAGAHLALAHTGTFAQGMSAGKGFIAIAVVVLGRWNPLGVLAAALFFGAASAFQFFLQAVGVDAPYQVILALPYLLTLAALAGWVGRARARRACPSLAPGPGVASSHDAASREGPTPRASPGGVWPGPRLGLAPPVRPPLSPSPLAQIVVPEDRGTVATGLLLRQLDGRSASS